MHFENGVKWSNCLVVGAPGADQGDGQIPEPGGAPEAHAGNAPTPETEAGALEADPGGLMLVLTANLHRRRLQNATAADLLRLLQACPQPVLYLTSWSCELCCSCGQCGCSDQLIWPSE